MNKITLFIITFVTWLLLTWSLHYQEVLIGAVVALLFSFLLKDILVINPYKFFSLKRFLKLLYYIPIFTYCCIKSNLDMAYRVIHPKLPIKPGIIKIKTKLKSPLARTFLANSITLTPGTLTVDIKDEYLYIHWIYVKTEDIEKATQIIAEKFEKILKEIFE